MMRQNTSLVIASLLSVLLGSLHLADDIVRGFEKGGPANLIAVPLLVAWLYAALVLGGRRSGYFALLALSLLGTMAPVLHFMGPGIISGDIGRSSGGFFFIWTLLAMGVTSLFAVTLCVRGLWSQNFEPPTRV